MLTLSTLLPFSQTAEAYGVINHEDVVDAGKNHFMVLKEDGTVWGWGDHTYGQLGAKGSNTTNPLPIQKESGSRLSKIKAIAAGSNHTVALDSEGKVWTWGRNNHGQLGYSTNSQVSAEPTEIPGITTPIVAIAAGEYHTLAVTANGKVLAWGRNDYGQIGARCPQPNTPSAEVCDVNGILVVAAGDNHSVALKNDGTVVAWGRNTVGQLGNGETTDVNMGPSTVSGLSNIVKIAAGANHTLALKQDSTSVYAWGFNSSGQLGDGGFESKLRPIQVQGMNKIKMIAAGNNHSIAIKEDGTVWTWGRNTSGMATNRSTPIQITGLNSAVAIGGGGDSDSYILAVKEDGTVWQWNRASSDPTTKLPIFKQVAGIDEVMKRSEFPFVQGSQVLFHYIGDMMTSAVEVYGNFNDWDSIPLVNKGGNIWELQVTLMPGEYVYGYKVNGVWTVDPLNPNKKVEMIDGSPYSVLKVAPYAVEGPLISNKEVTFTYSSYDDSGELELKAKTTYVAVIGDFTGWREVPLTKQANNIWTLTQTLEPGDHAYSFVVNDASTGSNREVRNDPLNDNIGTNAVTDISRNRFYVSEDILSTIPVKGITLNKGPFLNLIVGETTSLNVTVLPTNATNKNVLWSSSNPSIVSVNEAGKLTAHTSGTAVIAATPVAGGVSPAMVTVSVEKKDDAISYPRVGYKNEGDRLNVSPTKTWYIQFNQPLALNTINKETAYVMNESGINMDIGYKLSNNDQTLEIHLLNGSAYEKGANYYLFIEKAVKTKYGLQLAEPVQMKFTIQL